jgi:hypothetical protein
MLEKQTDAEIAKALTKKQLTRLSQIRLQILGPTAVAETAVAKHLMLSEDQFAQVQQILADMDQMVMTQMREAFGNGPGGPQGQGGPGRGRTGGEGQAGQARPQGGANGERDQARGNDREENSDRNQERRRGFDPDSPEFKAMQERMKESAEKGDDLRKQAEKAIGRVLLPRQKTIFNKMLGEPFDLEAMVKTMQQGGGPGGDRTAQRRQRATIED